MLQLTKRTDYAILALSYMARQPEARCSAREIVEQHHVSASLLMNVLKTLCQRNLVSSTRGAKGGYMLAAPPERISLAEIIGIMEGPVSFVRCAKKFENGKQPCEMMGTCPVSRPVRKVHRQLNEFLKKVTLAQIAFDEDYGWRTRAPSRARNAVG